MVSVYMHLFINLKLKEGIQNLFEKSFKTLLKDTKVDGKTYYILD